MVASQTWTIAASGWNWQEVRSRKARRKTRRDEEEESDEDEEDAEEDDDDDTSSNALLEIPPALRKPEAGPPGLDPPMPQRSVPSRQVQIEERSPILYPMRLVQPSNDRVPETGTEVRRQEWHCARCTLINAATASTCAACGALWPSGVSEVSAPSVAPDRRQPASWSWRARDHYPWAVIDNPEWKVIVENTFITVTQWRDRATRTSVSAPARLSSGKARSDYHCDSGNRRHDLLMAHRGHSPPDDRPQRSNSGPAIAGSTSASGAKAFAEGFRAAIDMQAKQVQVVPVSSGAEAAAGSPLPHEPIAVARQAQIFLKVPAGRQPYSQGLMKVAPAEAAAGPGPPGPPPGLDLPYALPEANADLAAQIFEVHIADEAAQGKKGCKKKVHIAEEAEMHVAIKDAEDELISKAGELSPPKEICAETQAVISEKQPIVFPSGALQAEYTVAQLSDLQINLKDEEEESIPELEDEVKEGAAEQERHVHFKEQIDIESMASLEGDDVKVALPAEDTPTNKTLKNRRKRQLIKARKARQKATESDLSETSLQAATSSREAADCGDKAVATTRTRTGVTSVMLEHSPVRRQAWSTRRCVRSRPEVCVLSSEEDIMPDCAESAQVDLAASSDTETTDLAEQRVPQVVAEVRQELLGRLSRASAPFTTSTAVPFFSDRACGNPSAALTCDAVDAVVSTCGKSAGAATTVLAALMRERAQASN